MPSAGCAETWAAEALRRSERCAPPHLTAAETQVSAHRDPAGGDGSGGGAGPQRPGLAGSYCPSSWGGWQLRAAGLVSEAALAISGHRLPASVLSTSYVPGSDYFPAE